MLHWTQHVVHVIWNGNLVFALDFNLSNLPWHNRPRCLDIAQYLDGARLASKQVEECAQTTAVRRGRFWCEYAVNSASCLDYMYPQISNIKSEYEWALNGAQKQVLFLLTCIPQKPAGVGRDHSGTGVVETIPAVVASVRNGSWRM